MLKAWLLYSEIALSNKKKEEESNYHQHSIQVQKLLDVNVTFLLSFSAVLIPLRQINSKNLFYLYLKKQEREKI